MYCTVYPMTCIGSCIDHTGEPTEDTKLLYLALDV